MNVFDILFALNIIAALVALTRARPALLILAVNQAITVRALTNIARYGQPATQWFLPHSVFAPGNLAIAGNLFLITTLFTCVFCLLPGRKLSGAPERLPRVPSWLMKLLIVYFIALIFSERTIITQTYADPERSLYNANLGGGTAFLKSIFLYEMVRRTMTGELTRPVGFGIVFLLFVATDYLHGSTGLATGFVVVAACLIFSGARPLRRTATIGAVLGGLLVLSISIRLLRSSIATGDGPPLADLTASITDRSAREQSDAQGLESMGNGTQYAAHVLECIALYESGISRQWRSVYLPLLYTFEPSFLNGPLGIERPKEAAWELADYFIHGGGIFVVGELYWNGGYPCVTLIFLLLTIVCWRVDITYRTGFVGLMMACHVGSNLLQGVGYGFAQASRGIINGLLALLIWRIARRLGLGARARTFALASGRTS